MQALAVAIKGPLVRDLVVTGVAVIAHRQLPQKARMRIQSELF
jgi:hypothetical protein